MAPRPLRALGATAVGAALVALGAGAAVRRTGGGLRRSATGRPDRLEDLAPLHHAVPTRDGGTVHVVEVGTGRPVVLLHGVTLQWWVWHRQLRSLGADHRVLAWDMRGHGASRAGTDGIDLAAVADDLAAVLETLDLREAVVVGHSMGGMALGRFCAEHHEVLEERVTGLVFMATSVATMALPVLSSGLLGLLNLVSRATTSGMRARLKYGWPDTDLAFTLVRSAFGRSPAPDDVADVRQMLSEFPPQSASDAGESIAQHDVRSDLAHVDVPTVVLVGEADLLTPPAHARLVRDCVPGAELVLLPGIGHQVMQEAPDDVDRIVRGLLARTGAR